MSRPPGDAADPAAADRRARIGRPRAPTGVLEVDLDLPMPGVALVRLTPAGHR